MSDGLVPANPCQVRGAGRTTRVRRIEVATLDELVRIVAGMPERLRLLVLLAAWCGLRYGELASSAGVTSTWRPGCSTCGGRWSV